MPYFAYGSNLNAPDLQAWCARNDLPYPLGADICRAWLPDYQLVFDRYSEIRCGGVANVAPRVGHAVPGVVFKVMNRGWHVLDRKEGAPTIYFRCEVTVLAENALGVTAPMLCGTYRRNPSEEFIPPHPEKYLGIVADGYKTYGLPPEQLNLPGSGREKPLPVFVYGTLQRGKRLHAHMNGFEFLSKATIPGRLLNCGSYPGLIQGEEGERVHGEIYRINHDTAPGELLGKLDGIEGFTGFGRQCLYERRIVAATDASGNTMDCWTYHWMGSNDLPFVANGVWQ